MELRPYQAEDVEFLKQHPIGGLFNQQRTGKTPTALKAVETHGCKKILIVCPASAVYQWKEEFERWLGRPCIAITGTPKKKKELISTWTDGLVISYGSFKETKVSSGCICQILLSKPDAMLLDEAHRIKDPKSGTAKSIFKTNLIPVRYALTGTPAPNKPQEVWSILHWLFPKRFRGYWSFIHTYFNTETQFGRGRVYEEIGSFKHRMDRVLQKELSEFTTQRTRKEVMPWLPEKDYVRVKLPPTKEQTKYLSDLKKYFETEDVVTQGVLDRLVRYRQVCLHPQLLKLKGASPKLEWLKQYVTDYPDRPTIVFSKFTSFIHILKDELKNTRMGVIIGDTPLKTRNEIKKDFQEGRLNLLIINIDAGKEALTLDRAECAIFLDKYPPAGDIQQAEDRFVSTTQDKADKPHMIIELMMKGTYDEELYKLLDLRASETDVINNYKQYLRKD